MTLPSWRDWLFSAKTFAAAMLAVYIGLWMAVPRPYWAMATVYICSQPLSGATRSKGVYRVFGTIVGAVAAVVLVPGLSNEPILLSAGLAAWTGVCLYFSLLDRTPRSYAFMLGGYTAALIGFPAVSDPAAIFDLAVARVEEITIGIVCATLMAGLVLPASVAATVATKINAWLGDMARLSQDAIAGERSAEQTRRDLVRLAGDAAEIDTMAAHLAYDGSPIHDVVDRVRSLRLRMLVMLPLLSSIHDRIAALRASGSPLSADLLSVIDHLKAWIRPDPPKLLTVEDMRRETEDTESLRAAIGRVEPPLTPASDWPTILTANLAMRLRELVDLASDSRVIRRSFLGDRRLTAPLVFNPEAGVAVARHQDHAMALLSALGVCLTIGLCCAFWIASGWPDGASAPMLAAVACCFFATQDDPVPAILQFANWSLVAIVLISIYQFALFPLVHDFEMLVLVMAPTFLVVGTMVSMPRTRGQGLALAANGSTFLALQGAYDADFSSYVNGDVALLVGMYASAVVLGLVRSVGAEWALARVRRAGVRTVAAAAAARGARNRARFAGLMLDRLGLMAPRLASLPPDHDFHARDLLVDVRVGLNVIDVRRSLGTLAPAARTAAVGLLDSLAASYGSSDDPARERLLARADAALGAVMGCDEGAAKRDAVIGIVGIRRALFPDAPPYRPGASPLSGGSPA